MRKTVINTVTVLCLLTLSAWKIKSDGNLDKAKWLIGTWENKTQRGSIYETWKIEGKNQLSGMSYMIKENDTIVFENIKLVQEDKELFYIPVVKNQNDGLPVKFQASEISETELVFKNEKHDFPQVISYKKITSDSIVAEISGTKNGQTRKMTFPMKKVQ